MADENRRWFDRRAHLVGPDDGHALFEVITDAEKLVTLVADALRALHETPLDGCPLATTPDELLEEARLRVEHGTVDLTRADAAYRRHRPERLLEVAQRTRPPRPDPGAVLVHGEATLSSLRLIGADVGDEMSVGWVDNPRFGAGDRYRDLATISIDLAGRVSPQALGPFFDVYGIEHVDLARLDFHVLLDQLLR
jgi:aminoglycoside phosphotransferase